MNFSTIGEIAEKSSGAIVVVVGGAVVAGAGVVDVVVDETAAVVAGVVVAAADADSAGPDPPEHADAIMAMATKRAGKGICPRCDMVGP